MALLSLALSGATDDKPDAFKEFSGWTVSLQFPAVQFNRFLANDKVDLPMGLAGK